MIVAQHGQATEPEQWSCLTSLKNNARIKRKIEMRMMGTAWIKCGSTEWTMVLALKIATNRQHMIADATENGWLIKSLN